MTKDSNCHFIGTANGKAKLNEQKVREMRDKYAMGVPVTALMQTYGMSSRAVEAVVHRLSWRHVD